MQAASDKRTAELKAVLNEINGRKGGREMTIDEVLMSPVLVVLSFFAALVLLPFLRSRCQPPALLAFHVSSFSLTSLPSSSSRPWLRSPNPPKRSTRTLQTTSGSHRQRAGAACGHKIHIIRCLCMFAALVYCWPHERACSALANSSENRVRNSYFLPDSAFR